MPQCHHISQNSVSLCSAIRKSLWLFGETFFQPLTNGEFTAHLSALFLQLFSLSILFNILFLLCLAFQNWFYKLHSEQTSSGQRAKAFLSIVLHQGGPSRTCCGHLQSYLIREAFLKINYQKLYKVLIFMVLPIVLNKD